MYRWFFTIEDNNKHRMSGKWDTTLPPTDICRYFEELCYTVVYLERQSELTAYAIENPFPASYYNRKEIAYVNV